MKTFKKIYSLLDSVERRRARALLLMIVVMAFLDMMGVASILPFMTVLTNPEQVHTNIMLAEAFTVSKRIGVSNADEFLSALGILVFLLLVISLAFKALTIYVQTRFVLMREYSIGKRLIERYLNQPYEWFLHRNSSDLIKTVLSEVSIVIGNGMTPLMTLIAQTAVALGLLALLVFAQPWLALTVGAVLGLVYAIIFAAMSNWLKGLGHERAEANKKRFSVISEAFGGVKEIKVGSLEQVYINRFDKPAKLFATSQAAAIVIAQVPRFALEAVAFGGMLLVILFFMLKSGDFSSALPTVALYAFAGYRLLPALQNIYAAFTQLRFVDSALDSICNDLKSLQAVDVQFGAPNFLPFTQSIRFEQVSYRYPEAPRPAINGVTLNIPAHSIVGFVGATGSGKTTMVDVILGLLKPQQGCVYVDNKPIDTENCRQWQRGIGYVPQHIYLADDSVAANIALGSEAENIEMPAVKRAAKMAMIDEFVSQDLPQGYATLVGERGVRLSGGQRQRIGIARALYRNPRLLVLDEATSALDNITEKSIMDSLNALGPGITVILIAHRLTTLRQCNKIYLVERGKITASGTYKELAESSTKFATMLNKA